MRVKQNYFQPFLNRIAGDQKQTMPEDDLIILSADTSTEMRSVAVLKGINRLSQRVSDLHQTGAASILSDLALALSDASITLGDIELFAVTIGPGSFTGLRSGLATMKALAATLKKPVIGVPTLFAIAQSVQPAERVAVMIPAGRGEVFAQILSVSAEGAIFGVEAPEHISPEVFVEKVVGAGGNLMWAGSGAQKFSELISRKASVNDINFAAASETKRKEPTGNVWELAAPVNALALYVGMIAKINFERGASANVEELRALYVRQSDAEIKEQCHAQS